MPYSEREPDRHRSIESPIAMQNKLAGSEKYFGVSELMKSAFCAYRIPIMTVFVKYIRKPLVQAIWGAETILTLAVARFLIKFVPFRYWRWTLGVFDEASCSDVATDELERARARSVGRWVRRTARKMPFEAVCLPQAMACRWMLLRRGLSSKLFLGTRRDAGTEDTAFHAWIMHGDLCLTGQHEKDSYTVFSKKPNDRSGL
jgi:hypothetical protein